ncbi:MarR family protein [Actinopolymorpha cephalotaxi]|uniref:DNA-binding transcriptional ArsR family regulator n=1 Tax=Actinopolymorpha cephalotaxi TaxID=504797 RepID=A0A1I3BBZ2_9ACTN|nr:MarR family transcriptional regulator [Actinopolymorpha cephalotaxi]NYH86787.1 DNA-binding transcriptional ArsR family regulator [Actinopolymorpha cephalotaxi]SFH59459.1 MarR family protein [Actinopolymorpha cephalotaxi]
MSADEADVVVFRERFAQIMVESGMPRMAARVYAALMVADSGRLSAAELTERLGVGASAISGAVKYLVQVRLVERGREPGSRHDFCRIHEHTWSHFISQSDPVLVQVQAGADEGIAVLGPDSPAGRRMDETSRFFAFLREEMKQSMVKWRRLQAAERETGSPTGSRQ